MSSQNITYQRDKTKYTVFSHFYFFIFPFLFTHPIYPFVQYSTVCKADELPTLRKTARSGFSSAMAAADHIYMLLLP
jgi:hypothetical protein